MKSKHRSHNSLRKRINLGSMLALVMGQLLVGGLLWQQKIDGSVAWGIQCLASGALLALVIALWVSGRKAPMAPLHNIAEWASRIRQGDFSARLEGPKPPTKLNDKSGLDGLTDDINRLAEWLESLAVLKNQELLEQDARLQTQTHIIRLLYDISGQVSHDATATKLLEQTIVPMAEVLAAWRIEFHRYAGEGEKPTRVATYHAPPGTPPSTPPGTPPSTPPSTPSSTPSDAPPHPAPVTQRITLPLRVSDGRDEKGYGECRIWFAAERFPLPDELSQLLYTLGRNIGMALERVQRHQESMRISKMEARTDLANELHDSLAQTIAGLRFQVRVLDDLLHQQEGRAVWAQLGKVEDLLEEANAELRSLIAYFRGQLEPGGLGPAIESMVARFRSETTIPLFFQAQWGAVDLPEKWQLEIIRIIQESLTNIRKHSHAKNARLLLRLDGGEYSVLVEDDGVGVSVSAPPPDHSPGEHIGLEVMATRAKSLGGDFQVESEPGEGTRILLSFQRPPVESH